MVPGISPTLSYVLNDVYLSAARQAAADILLDDFPDEYDDLLGGEVILTWDEIDAQLSEYQHRVTSLCLCADCGMDTLLSEYYMVDHSLWRAAGGHRTRYLCVGCLERRLGRTLTHRDFTSAPVNVPNGWTSDRLRSRLLDGV